MMMIDDTSTPTQTDESGTEAASEESGPLGQGGDDLDALLAEFESGNQETTPASGDQAPAGQPPKSENALLAEIQALRAEVRAVRSQVDNQTYRGTMSSAIGVVRGELDPERFDDSFVETWIQTKASQDARIANAWAQRDRNPQAFTRLLKAIGGELQDRFGDAPRTQSSDTEQLAAAVRGSSNRRPAPAMETDYSDMSDEQFATEKMRLDRVARANR